VVLTVIVVGKTFLEVCGTSQLFVLILGLTYFSQLHPGSSVTLATVRSPRFTNSIFSFSPPGLNLSSVQLSMKGILLLHLTSIFSALQAGLQDHIL